MSFYFFGREENFYENPHHDLSYEPTEKKYHLTLFTCEELKRNLAEISESLRKRKETQSNKNLSIPKFEELKKYLYDYSMVYSSNNSGKYKIRDLKTGKIVDDENIKSLVVFSNIWLASAGVKYYCGEVRSGEIYAFNGGAEDTYNFFVKSIEYNLKTTGNIDSVEIFRNSDSLMYKYSQDIVCRMFGNEPQTKFLEDFFRARFLTDRPKTKETLALYDAYFANSLAYSNNEFQVEKRNAM